MFPQRYLYLLKIFDSLPQSAVLPIPVAAAILGISQKTVIRKLPLVKISVKRSGVRKADVAIASEGMAA
jgi:hypothetical protein